MKNITMGLLIYRHSDGIEWVLAGRDSGQLKFLKREVLLDSSVQAIKASLKAFIKTQKIRGGAVWIGVSGALVKSFVLGNLALGKREKETAFPFVLAHLKQHLGDDLSDLSVDFKRISAHQLWIVTCPRTTVLEALSLKFRSFFTEGVEPAIYALLRLLSSVSGIKLLEQQFAFFWIDPGLEKKNYRLTLCQGLQLIWDQALNSMDITSALDHYRSDPMVFSKMGPILKIYLWIEPTDEKDLIERLRAFFNQYGWKTSQVITLVPAQFGLKAADEFVSLGLACR